MSTPSQPATPSPKRDKPANRWHRNAGIAAVGVLVYLLATGVPLQFSAELALGQRHIHSAWILDWYGLRAPQRVMHSGEVAQIGEQLYRDGRMVATMSPLRGAVRIGEFLVIAGRGEVLLLPNEADAAPETTHLPVTVNRLGSHDGRAYLDSDGTTLVADALLLNWQPVAEAPPDIKWAAVGALADSEAAPYRNRFRERMLTMERWLQDLHSGRFFGAIGVLIIDLASALMLVLAGTGLVLWSRSRRGSR